MLPALRSVSVTRSWLCPLAMIWPPVLLSLLLTVICPVAKTSVVGTGAMVTGLTVLPGVAGTTGAVCCSGLIGVTTGVVEPPSTVTGTIGKAPITPAVDFPV